LSTILYAVIQQLYVDSAVGALGSSLKSLAC